MFLLNVATIRWIVFFFVVDWGGVHEMQVYLFAGQTFRWCCLSMLWRSRQIARQMDLSLSCSCHDSFRHGTDVEQNSSISVLTRFSWEACKYSQPGLLVQSDPKLLVLFTGTFGSFSTVPSRSIAWSLWSMVGRVKTGRVKPFLSQANVQHVFV